MKGFVKIITVILTFVILISSATIFTFAQNESTDTADAAGEEDLLFGHLQTALESSMSVTHIKNRAGDYLTGDLKTAYDVIAEKVQKIAAGEIDSSVITIEYGKDISSDEWRDAFGDGFYSDVLYALLNDFPYEFYWFDKTAGTALSLRSTTVVVSLSVAKDYAKDYDEADNAANYTLNVVPQKVNTAKTNIQKIIDDNGEKNDYDKLCAYRKAICNAVEYDHAAANGEVSYGDSFQLISVFDDDSSTNVVCEGYSKAFKYLCDLSTWENEVYCYLANGLSVDVGPHMWNVVEIGGENYLVDLTQDDEIESANDDFFLNGSSNAFPDYNEGTGKADNYGLMYIISSSKYSKQFKYAYGKDSMLNMFGEEYLELSATSYSSKTFAQLSVIYGNGSNNYGVGTKVTLSSTPDESRCFDKWEIVSGNVEINDLNKSEISFNMPNESVTIKAVYKDHDTENGFDDAEHYRHCKSCDMIIEREKHTLSFLSDDTEHWQICSCGYTTERFEHIYQLKEIIKDYANNKEKLIYECVCSHTKENETVLKVETQETATDEIKSTEENTNTESFESEANDNTEKPTASTKNPLKSLSCQASASGITVILSSLGILTVILKKKDE